MYCHRVFLYFLGGGGNSSRFYSLLIPGEHKQVLCESKCWLEMSYSDLLNTKWWLQSTMCPVA